MNTQPEPIHRFLASAVLAWVCRTRRTAFHQCRALADEVSRQYRDTTTSIRELFAKNHKTALLELSRAFGGFLFDTFIRSPIRLVNHGITTRSFAFMCAGLIPLLAAAFMIAVPAMVFNTPNQQAYFFFARMLQSDAASLIPVLLGLLSLIVALRFPLHSDDPHHAAHS